MQCTKQLIIRIDKASSVKRVTKELKTAR